MSLFLIDLYYCIPFKLWEHAIKLGITGNKLLIDTIMGKGQDAKKNVKKQAAKTLKEKKAEKRLKKSKSG